MKSKHEIATFGYAVGLAANDMGTAFAPVVLQRSSFLEELSLNLHWKSLFYINQGKPHKQAIPFIAETCARLADGVRKVVKRGERFLVFGGDHSCAIGTWSGAAAALHEKGDLGLIWIDAHLDSHTLKTTHTGNIHGMSLAVLLGKGDKDLTEVLTSYIKIKPSNICIVGARSFESEELELLQKLQVKIYFIDDILQRGLAVVMKEAIALASKNTAGFGVSLDMDSVTPEEAPGVGTPVDGGLKKKRTNQSVCRTCKKSPIYWP